MGYFSATPHLELSLHLGKNLICLNQ